MKVEVSEPLLRQIDYADIQQCMHCGMCLPTCPTYDETKLERNSPRGRIALMRAIADGKLEVTTEFAKEMYYCLGCLACETACPAGVDYTHLFETARADAERSGVIDNPRRKGIRSLLLKGLFTRPRLLRLVGRGLWLYQASGFQKLFRALGLNRLLPGRLRNLEAQTPTACTRFSHQLIRPVETPSTPVRHKVAVLTGCVQDILFSDINRDTVDVLLANGCEVHTPSVQSCCGSLHGHNGEPETAALLARRLIDTIPPEKFDAIITNAAGCGSHLKHYDRLLEHDSAYREKAVEWSRKLRDIHEWLSEIGLRPPKAGIGAGSVTYHEACHLCHGQKITRQPREILQSIPGLQLEELKESTWCCGSAGIYNITQPEMAAKLQKRKIQHLGATSAAIVSTANPGCHLQLENGLKSCGDRRAVRHPISLLAQAYRNEP
jgi:glycolate oxidase iron-sulfur subunit